MKRLFKFFPVALAVLALASCSDDLQVADNGQELQFEKGKLYVQVEGNGQTRGGFASAVYENASGVNSLFNALYFEAGDRIKVYCDQSNWRSQVWKLAEDQQYLKKNGVASFEPEDGSDKYVQQSEIAYGIFPYVNDFDETVPNPDYVAHEYGFFASERRDAMIFRFADQATAIEYSAEEIDYKKTSGGNFTGETVKGNFYKTPFPLWGVKAAGVDVMTMKYLTGILRLDLVVPTAASAGNANYLVIVADKPVNGMFMAETDPATLGAKAPELVPMPGVASAYAADEQCVDGGEIKNNVLLVKLDEEVGHKLVYLPLPAQEYSVLKVFYLADKASDFSAKLGTDLIADNLLYDVIGNDLIDTENTTQNVANAEENTVYAGTWYRVVDDKYNVNTSAHTPYELAKGIMDADKIAYRDFTIHFEQPIEVKNNDTSTQNFWLDLTNSKYSMEDYPEGYELNHNVTVDLELNESADAGTVPTKLYIKTKGISGAASGKTLTLNIRNAVGTPIDTIVVDADLKDNLILKVATGKLPVIRNFSNLEKVGGVQKAGLTIQSGSEKVYAQGEMNIQMPWVDKVNNLYLGKGVSKVNLLNGQITNIDFLKNDGEKIEGDVTIYSEGRSVINNVAYVNMPVKAKAGDATKKVDVGTLKFESKLTTTTGAGAEDYAEFTGCNAAVTKVILTATQLISYVGATNDAIILGTYDLNEKGATIAELQKSITGAANLTRGEWAATAATPTANITGSTTIKNLKGANGLVAKTNTAAVTIKNITFEGTNTVTGADGAKYIGLLVGEAAVATTIENIAVNGTNTISAPGKSSAIGGVIGKVTANAALTNVKVNNATTVEGQKYIGGIIGEVAGNTSLGNSTDAGLCTFAGDLKMLITHPVGSATYSENFAKKGTLIGSVTKVGAGATDGVTIQLGAAPNKTTGVQPADAYWISLDGGETYKHQLKTYYQEVGLSGVKGADAANAPAVDAEVSNGKIIFEWKGANWAAGKLSRSFVFNNAAIIADEEPADVASTNTYYMNWVCKTPMTE